MAETFHSSGCCWTKLIWVLTLCKQSIAGRTKEEMREKGKLRCREQWLLSLSPAVFPDWTLIPHCQCHLVSVACCSTKHRTFVCTIHLRWPGFNRKVFHPMKKKEMLLFSWSLLWNLKYYLTSENICAVNCCVSWNRANYSIKSTLSFNLTRHWRLKFSQNVRSYPRNEKNIQFQIISAEQLRLTPGLV